MQMADPTKTPTDTAKDENESAGENEAKPSDAKIEMDDSVRLASLMLGYSSMLEVANEIATNINRKIAELEPDTVKGILIVDTLNYVPSSYAYLQILSLIRQFEKQITSLESDLLKLLAPDVDEQTRAEALKIMLRRTTVTPLDMAGIRLETSGELPPLESTTPSDNLLSGVGKLLQPFQLVTTGLGILRNIASFFQNSYNYKGQAIKVDDEALRVSVAGSLSSKATTYLLNFRVAQSTEIIREIVNLVGRKPKLASLRDAVRSEYGKEKKASEGKSGQAVTEELPKKDDEIVIENPQAALALADYANIIDAFDDFITAISSTADSNTPSLLLSAMMHELERSEKISHLLYLKVTSSAGDSIMAQGPLAGGKTVFMGGVICSYVLVTKAGEVVLGETITRSKQIKHDVENVDSSGVRNLIPQNNYP
jgi:hypothetical protein